ncbi:MAG TPA: peptidoglycan-binding domain-containing protein [Syntrophomonadaceae bacterium]|nr:peptidoglycan-binding domain-containing protein [Syntrophomonadaceae bacterium]HQA07980.1 peptidoglycan-binding domain-containing protein [Syntrophomonadaceae bacterium]
MLNWHMLVTTFINKRILIGVMAVVFALMLIGCSNSSEIQPAETTVTQKKEIPSDADIIGDLTGDRDSTDLRDEDMLELRHWKYAVKPVDTSPYGSTVISYQLVSEEDMDRIINRLTEGGYLSGQPGDEYEFSMALRDFQHDQGLPITGELDSDTLKALLRDQDL